MNTGYVVPTKPCAVCDGPVEPVPSDHPFRRWAESRCATCRFNLAANARLGW